MKKNIAALAVSLVFALTTSGYGADVLVDLPIENALNDINVKNELIPDVQLFWGDQKTPETKTVYGEYKTSQRTNALGKSREDACQWALASSIKQLQARATREGADAVINIRSNIKNREFSSETEYQCLAGTIMVNVALKGTVVKLAE